VKIGFLGGRFDPVHFGHLGAACDALVEHQLDRVVFVPTAQVPHQAQRIQAAAADRLAMLRLAMAAEPQFEISEFELGRPGASYTIDSVRAFRRLHPTDRLFWIIGSDQLRHLPEWKEIHELAGLIEFIVLARPGSGCEPAVAIPGLRLLMCQPRPRGTSSTEVRARARSGESLDELVPSVVADYIVRRGLYREPGPPGEGAGAG
jgi:nicotinate-nucleotide adenylyltransferase